jgi:hypothetical protein
MPVVNGTVDRIFVNPTFCCVTLRTSATATKLMLLWSYGAQEDNATNRLTHGAYLALVRDALLHGRRIEFAHATSSSLVDSVTLID